VTPAVRSGGARPPRNRWFSPHSGPATRSCEAWCSGAAAVGALGSRREPLEPRQRAGTAGRCRPGRACCGGSRPHGHQRHVVPARRSGGRPTPHPAAGSAGDRCRRAVGDRRSGGRSGPGGIGVHRGGHRRGGCRHRTQARRRGAGTGAVGHHARGRWRRAGGGLDGALAAFRRTPRHPRRRHRPVSGPDANTRAAEAPVRTSNPAGSA
jgi:hypothetical protein